MATCPGPGRSMGLDFGLDRDDISWKRKFRWLFIIPNISADSGASMAAANSLPPKKGARPSLGWKEYEFQHVTETIWYPLKPDWKPIDLVLYDLRCNINPVFEWVRQNQAQNGPGMYDPQPANWQPIVDGQLKRDACIVLLDGCGNVIEAWTLENCYPSSINWGELDMESSELVTVDLSLRYDRAYLTQSCGGGGTVAGDDGDFSGAGGDFGDDNTSSNSPNQPSEPSQLGSFGSSFTTVGSSSFTTQ